VADRYATSPTARLVIAGCRSCISSTQPGKPETTDEIKRQLNLTGFARHSLPKEAQKTSFSCKEEYSEIWKMGIRTSDVEAPFKIQFRDM
jgi:hypothetical protein